MNTPADDGDDNLRYAEYVLGVLHVDARAAVAHEVAITSEAAVAVALWQRRLMPLADTIDEVAPAPHVWARIRDSLQLDAAARLQPRNGLWDNLQLWRWFGIGAGAMSAALLVVVYLPRPALMPTVVNAGYMASTLVGGSPTGQPTGPVIAKGAIGAAPDAGARKVAVSKVGRADRTSV